MSSTVQTHAPHAHSPHEHSGVAHAAEPKTNYLTANYGWKSWVFSVDHKRIALMYLFTIAFMILVGGVFALLVRLELATPAGDLLQSENYNKIFTMHGVVMVFFFLIPGVPAVLGNFLLPIMIGAKDLAFPKINLLSYYVFLVGILLTLTAAAMGGVDTGWTFYTPYSSTYANSQVALAAVAVFITGFSSILTGLNFVVTVHKMRAPGMTWFRLPLFVWANYATGLIILLSTPVVAITIVLVALERLFHIGVFDPAYGGDPVLFQHMFWFYSHPAVYIMILPAMGVISELIAAFSKKRVFGYPVVAFSSLAIAVIGFFVWGHHMFVSGQSTYAGVVFSVITMLVAVPSAIKVFNWVSTMYKGDVLLSTPMCYAIAFLGLFTVGGLTGIFLGTMGLDIHMHDTYFVVAHFHYVMVGGMVTAFWGGLHFWWPKMFGRMYPEAIGRVAAALMFIGFNMTFFPQFILGYMGMPRRYHFYPEEWQVLNLVSTLGATLLGISYLLPMIYLPWSLKFGKVAGKNPWGAKGLEWEADSPPTTFNFDKTPIVTEEAYAYPEGARHQPEAKVV